MFDIYMEAYKLNADAIILNSSNVSTSISGHVTTNRNIFMENTVSGSTRSSSEVQIMATLVKYKKVKNLVDKPIEKKELDEVIA